MRIQREVVIVLHVRILLSATFSSVVLCGSSLLRTYVALLYNCTPSAHAGWTGESKPLLKRTRSRHSPQQRIWCVAELGLPALSESPRVYDFPASFPWQPASAGEMLLLSFGKEAGFILIQAMAVLTVTKWTEPFRVFVQDKATSSPDTAGSMATDIKSVAFSQTFCHGTYKETKN